MASHQFNKRGGCIANDCHATVEEFLGLRDCCSGTGTVISFGNSDYLRVIYVAVNLATKLSQVAPGDSCLSHTCVRKNGSTAPDGSNTCFQGLRVKAGILYKLKIGSGMDKSLYHCPLGSVQTVIPCLFLDDLETQRFNFSWGNFGDLNHCLSSHFVMTNSVLDTPCSYPRNERPLQDYCRSADECSPPEYCRA